MELQTVITLAQQNTWQFETQAALSAYTTFRIGGPADLLVTVPSGEAASKLLQCCRRAAVPTFLLGNGSNLLIGDHGVRGVVWRFDPATAVCALAVDGVHILCDAGVPLTKLCRFAQTNALTGLEFAYGIPGTAGGAAFMNAGAYGGQMADVLESAVVLDQNGVSRTVQAAEMALGYRQSAFMEQGLVVVQLCLRLQPGDAQTITATMQDLLARRREKQPLTYPSAGSFFKRPVGYYAGGLIEECGLKGYTVGGAAVSEKHAGFVVNRGGATAADVRRLATDVIEKVQQETGVTLEPEVRFIGAF